MRFGCIPDESLESYHSNDALSKTRLDVFRSHRELYRKVYVSKEIARPAPTEAMILGAAAGAYVMEGVGAFAERYVVAPADAPKKPTQKQRDAKDPSIKTLDAILWWDEFERCATGKQVLSSDQLTTIQNINAALRKNPQFIELTSRGNPEVTFRIQGERFAVQVRPDWWNEEGCSLTDGYPLIVDMKTIAELPDDDDDHLSHHIAKYGYHRSAYLYPEITALALRWNRDVPRPRFFLAFVEKEEPYNTDIRELPDFDVQVGEREVTTSLRQLRRCLETGLWSEPRLTIRTISLPGYYVKKSVEATDGVFA